MSQINAKSEQQVIQAVSSKKIQVLGVALLGFVILSVVGFAPIEVIHNATHDTRHSTGFPCH